MGGARFGRAVHLTIQSTLEPPGAPEQQVTNLVLDLTDITHLRRLSLATETARHCQKGSRLFLFYLHVVNFVFMNKFHSSTVYFLPNRTKSRPVNPVWFPLSPSLLLSTWPIYSNECWFYYYSNKQQCSTFYSSHGLGARELAIQTYRLCIVIWTHKSGGYFITTFHERTRKVSMTSNRQ